MGENANGVIFNSPNFAGPKKQNAIDKLSWLMPEASSTKRENEKKRKQTEHDKRSKKNF